MRLKISLEVLPQISGTVLPISYQFELSVCFNRMITANPQRYEAWLKANGLTLQDNEHFKVYALSNLYVPKIRVIDDRLEINVPRIQFWVSLLPEIGTRQFLEESLLGMEFSVGDCKSAVSFRVTEIDDISPVEYNDVMEYQSLAPIVVKALRQNNTLEYLSPTNPVFAQFLVDGIIERWEAYYKMPYTGNRRFDFALLCEGRRKAVAIFPDTAMQKKVIGYMIKFYLAMAPELQEFAYTSGIGDDIQYGFGYIELLKKKK